MRIEIVNILSKNYKKITFIKKCDEKDNITYSYIFTIKNNLNKKIEIEVLFNKDIVLMDIGTLYNKEKELHPILSNSGINVVNFSIFNKEQQEEILLLREIYLEEQKKKQL